MVGKAWRLATTRRRRAAWAAEAVSVVLLAALIAPVTGGANWLTSTMRVLRQALAPCSRNLCTAVPIAAERVGATRADRYGCTRKELARATIWVPSGWRSEGPRGSASIGTARKHWFFGIPRATGAPTIAGNTIGNTPHKRPPSLHAQKPNDTNRIV